MIIFNLFFFRNHNRTYADPTPAFKKRKYSEYIYKCTKYHTVAVTVYNSNSASRRIVLLLIHTRSWIALEQGVHSENMTSIDLKRGIDPLFLEFIDDEIERDTTPREILRLIKAKDWNDSVDFPTEIQISNRKSHIAHNKEGPLTQYKYAVNIKHWVNENIMKSKGQYQALHVHDYEKSTTHCLCIHY